MWILSVILFYCALLGLVSSCSPPFGRQFHAEERVAFNHLRIENDPEQVKPDVITPDNLFGWLNMKNLVRFKLWTRLNPQLAHEIKFKDLETLRTSNFNMKRLTKILIHGFADTATEQSITYYLIDLKDAYLKLADLNVIIMDYSLFTMPIFYLSGFPEVASARLAEYLRFLVESSGAMLDSIHLVGFSWGAHVAGLAGHALEGQIGRITGLDPAGPSFRFVDNEFRLDSSDARFVDIIHTNGGSTLLFGGHLGFSLALGHVDIFPNGGERQIGCPKTDVLIYETLECSHGRAVRFFTESITKPLTFPSCKCETLGKFVRGECPCGENDIAFMGEHLSHKARGTFQLITRSHKPFGHGPQISISLPNIPNLSLTNANSSSNPISGSSGENANANTNETPTWSPGESETDDKTRSVSTNDTNYEYRRNSSFPKGQVAKLEYKGQKVFVNYTQGDHDHTSSIDIVKICIETLITHFNETVVKTV